MVNKDMTRMHEAKTLFNPVAAIRLRTIVVARLDRNSKR